MKIAEIRRMADEANARLDILEVCHSNLQRARAGGFVCPFCNSGSNKDSAVSIYKRDNRGYCHACSRPFTPLDVIGAVHGTDDLREQIRLANVRVDSPVIHDPRPAQHEKLVERVNHIERMNDAFIALYEPEAARALNFLYGRGFTDDDIVSNGWGWVRHPRDIFPVGFNCRGREGGFVCLPFPDQKEFTSARYAVFRAVDGGSPKELKRKGYGSHVWKSYLLQGRGGTDTVAICEGIFDAAAFTRLYGYPACAICGNGGEKAALKFIERTPADARPHYLIATDDDPKGWEYAETLANGINSLGGSFSRAVFGGHADPNDLLIAMMKGGENNVA